MRGLTLLLFWGMGLYAAEAYTLGQGYRFGDLLTAGAYVSVEYEEKRHERRFKVEDLAVLGYGTLAPSLTYLAEFEATNIYIRDFDTHTEQMGTEFHVERAYLDYKASDALQVRAGKMITPIGIWNREPINVLRDTTSNPLYATEMFPRLLSGVDLYGYLPGNGEFGYHLFGQKTRDLDEEYINIPNEHYFGAAISYDIDMQSSVGASVGEFVTRQDERFRYVQANFLYDAFDYKVTAEGILRHNDSAATRRKYSGSAYVQGLYRVTPQHSAVVRYEYFDDRSYDDDILILGYGYRPRYPISFKAEYQWHSQSAENRFLTSISVLF